MSELERALLQQRLKRAASAAFTAESAADYHRPGQLTMSGLGGCVKRCALAWAGEEPTDPDADVGENRAANLGRWIHTGFLPRLAEALGDAVIEQPVATSWNGMPMEGHADLVVIGDVLLDLKTINPYDMAKIDEDGDLIATVPLRHRLQVYGYAEACGKSGMPVNWVAWMFLDRAFGEIRIPVEAFGDEQCELLYERYAEIDAWAKFPDDAPREGLAMEPWVCGSCEFRQRCLGAGVAVEDIGARRLDVFSDAEITDACLRYRTAVDAEAAAKDTKANAKKVLIGQAAGVYGPSQITYTKNGAQRVTEARRVQ